MTDIDMAALRAAAENPIRMTTFGGEVQEWFAANPAVVLELLDRLAAAEGALRWIVSDAPHDGADDAEDAMHARAMAALALVVGRNLQGPQIATCGCRGMDEKPGCSHGMETP